MENTTDSEEPISMDPSKMNGLLEVQANPELYCKKGITLTAEELLALPQVTFTTKHSWSTAADTFSGPSLETVLELVCPDVERLYLKALNGYSINLDFSKIKSYKPIIAIKVNGKRIRVREKGPLWIFIPFDEFKALPERSLDEAMIWQLYHITILSKNEKL